MVLNHVPVHYYDFRHKVIYITHMIRQIIRASKCPEALDDKDYYGNKRIELYVTLLVNLKRSNLLQRLVERTEND